MNFVEGKIGEILPDCVSVQVDSRVQWKDKWMQQDLATESYPEQALVYLDDILTFLNWLWVDVVSFMGYEWVGERCLVFLHSM